MPVKQFQANQGTIRLIIDYPFDEEAATPADDVLRVNQIKGLLGDENTLVWLPHFLSDDRIADLSNLIVINYLLERDRLAEVTPNLDHRGPPPRPHPARQPAQRAGQPAERGAPPRLRSEQPRRHRPRRPRHRSGHDAGPRPHSPPARRASHQERLPPPVLPAA